MTNSRPARPRTAWEKSVCSGISDVSISSSRSRVCGAALALPIGVSFTCSSAPSANQSYGIAPNGPRHDEHPPLFRETIGQVPIFLVGMREIRLRQQRRVIEDRRGLLERNALLVLVLKGLV